jgi:hypothetical protein
MNPSARGNDTGPSSKFRFGDKSPKLRLFAPLSPQEERLNLTPKNSSSVWRCSSPASIESELRTVIDWCLT